MKRYSHILKISSFLWIVFLLSCNQQPSNQSTTEESVKPIELPQFSGDSSYQYTKTQLDFGPRIIGSKAHQQCASFLSAKLKQFGFKVYEQKAQVKLWDGSVVNIINIIGSYKPEVENRLMYCAHWDSRSTADHDPDKNNWNKPVPGANDGAGSVGTLLEVARQVQRIKPSVGLDIIFFDAEDYGKPQYEKQESKVEHDWGLGSQYWAKTPHVINYKAKYGILLDMTSASGAKFYLEGHSMQYAPDVLQKVWKIASELGFYDYFINIESSPITDDHYYINTILGLPTIDIIHRDAQSNSGFYKYWHTVKDDIQVIDKATQMAVGQTLIAVLLKEQN